ncbi:MAG TPA: CaiB/BaiF CoA-transferase family protein [Anaerolineales bacterium]|nr:CaiB/BaiF CoA-transferase family protein [Anaerolineales bacterium]
MTPLRQIRILDLSRLLPGPYTTCLLADLGAEVIKIETPRLGDYAREAPPEFGGTAMFEMLNRGKQSVALNYRNQQGRELFLKLAENADIIVETFKPGSVDKWGIGYEAVRERNSRIIYCSLSGYGQTGPYANRPGHDLNYIAIGGLLGLTGTAKSGPVPPAAQIADLGGATFAALHILAALLQRAQTGEGQYIDVAMLDPIVHWVLPTLGSQYFGTGQVPERGLLPLAGGWPSNNVYATADGRHLTLGALEPPFWSEFCRVTDRNDLLPHAFDLEKIPAVAEIFRQKTTDEWLKMFDGVDCPLELVLTLPEMLRHEQVVHRGLVRGADLGQITASRLESPFPYPPGEGEAPSLGRDTRAVLEFAGYTTEEIEQLAEKKIIKLAD